MTFTPEIEAQLESYVVSPELDAVNYDGYINWYVGLLAIYARATPENFHEIDNALEVAHAQNGYGDLKAWWNTLTKTKYFKPPSRHIISRRA